MIYSIAHAFAHEVSLSKQSTPPLSRRARSKGIKEIRLKLNGQALHFRSLDDFSFSIEARTSVPSARFYELLDRTPPELRQEAKSIKSVEKNLVDILEDALIDAAACGPAIRELGLQVFSSDHDWRPLMAELNELGEDFEPYKRLALIKYMQYLGARQEVLRIIFSMKDTGATSTSEQIIEQKDEQCDFGETAIFDITPRGDSDPTENPLERLPRGEMVRAHVLPGHALEIRFSNHAFRVVNKDGWALLGPQGLRFNLSTGRNTIGRGSENSVSLGKEFRNVSRRHLVAEPIDDHVILLTDISSHGTFAPTLHLERPAR
jgi:hypothetical protein